MGMKTSFRYLMFQTKNRTILNKDGSYCQRGNETGANTAGVDGSFGVGHVSEDPDVVVVAMGVEGYLLLVGAAWVHVVV